MRGMFFEGACKPGARGDIGAHGHDQLAHFFVVGALGHNIEGLHQWHAGFHHGRQLPGENGDIGRFNFFGAKSE